MFDKIMSIDLSCPDYDKIKNSFFENIGFLPFFCVPFDIKTLEELSLYRTRPASQIKQRELGITNTFGAPPITKNVGIQRASWKCRNVFYGSDSFETALLESKRLNDGEEFYVSKWLFDLEKLKDKSYEFRVLFNEELPKNNPWYNFTKGFTEIIDSHRKECGEESAVELEYLHKRLCDLFLMEDTKYYPLTAFMADYLIYNKLNSKEVIFFPFMIYPSVENNHLSCNFAIHPSFVLNYMYLESVSHVRVLNSSKGNQKLEFKKIGRCENRLKVKWYTTDINVSKANWYIEYVACYSCGRIIWNKDFTNLRFQFDNSDVDIYKEVGILLQKKLKSILDNIRIRDFDFKEMIILTQFFELTDFRLLEEDKTHEHVIAKIKIGIPLIYKEI